MVTFSHPILSNHPRPCQPSSPLSDHPRLSPGSPALPGVRFCRSALRTSQNSFNASIGWMRSARRAGAMPPSMPTMSITADVPSSGGSMSAIFASVPM